MLPRVFLKKRVVGAAILVVALAAALFAGWYFRPIAIPESPDLASLDADPARGKYLATIGNCAACHNASDGARYAGGVKFVTDFGTIYSTNITPDPENGIGRWTFAQFHRAMKHGIGDGGEHLYPTFPYTSFVKMTDDDIASLYAYLKTVRPVARPSPDNKMSFPFGNRELLYFWKRMYHDPQDIEPDSGQSAGVNRGEYLVRAVAHCGECHTPRGILGGADPDREFHGGTYVDSTRRGTYRRWSAVDLTPGPHGLPRWNAEDFEAYLSAGVNRHAVVHGPMNEVIEASAKMTPEDQKAVAKYFEILTPSPERFGWNLPSWGKDEGEVVYTVHCGTCHLPDGKGDPTLGVSLHQNPIVQAADPSSLINVILYGPELPPPPFAVSRTRMKPFGKRLSDEDIAAVSTYLRSNFGNRAGKVSAGQVAQQR